MKKRDREAPSPIGAAIRFYGSAIFHRAKNRCDNFYGRYTEAQLTAAMEREASLDALVKMLGDSVWAHKLFAHKPRKD